MFLTVYTEGIAEPRRVESPSDDQIARMVKQWEYTQRRSRILLLLDLSERRIDLLKHAIEKQL